MNELYFLVDTVKCEIIKTGTFRDMIYEMCKRKYIDDVIAGTVTVLDSEELNDMYETVATWRDEKNDNIAVSEDIRTKIPF